MQQQARSSSSDTSELAAAASSSAAGACADSLDSRFECPICLGCLAEPILTSCGHRFCRDCIYQWVQNKEWRCPIDNRVLGKQDLYPDKSVLAEIMDPFLSCPFADRGCKSMLSPWDLETHVASCTFQRRPEVGADECGGGCQWCGASPDDLQKHLDDECAKVPCCCRFREVGCRATLPRADLPAHLDSHINEHLDLVSAAYKKLSEVVRVQSRDLIDFKSQDAAKNWEAPPKETSSEGTQQPAGEASSDLLRTLFERVVSLEQKNHEQEIQLRNIEQKVRRDLLLHSGHYVWEIRDFSRQLQTLRAALPELKKLYSTPFFTAPFGYRFCVRVNLNAAGDALSVHVHLLKGEHDHSLSWPFRGRIVLAAVNQSGGQDVREPMAAQAGLAAFHRPSRDINHVGYGFAEFVSLRQLADAGFVRDDTLVLRVHVQHADPDD
ncbi:TNF receptor-associated factor 6-like isoform X2 [Cloeon dipterum]|uniref:TNF receptor-associated factor 6-like isoform X2 n=1 Tax=Cloeon dipterum TaxID=197152 RepID=UPI0032202A2D